MQFFTFFLSLFKVEENLNKQPPPAGNTHLNGGMSEAYMSANGGYYANNTGFPAMSFPNFSQPAQWSTATNTAPPNAPQSYDHTAMQYSGLNAAPNPPANGEAPPQNPQFVTADHLFNQNNSNYQNAFSAAPFMNGNWSYFNNPNSYFFPTGNGDLNLNWGAAAPTDNPNNALFQDLYKPPPPPTELEKPNGEINPVNELPNNVGFDNEIKAPTVEQVEQSVSSMSVNAPEKEVEQSIEAPVVPPPSHPINPVVNAPVKTVPPSKPIGHSNAPAKPVSWAAVASQPAKSKPPPKKIPPKNTTSSVPINKPAYSTQIVNNNVKGKQQPPSGGRWSRQNQGNQNSSNSGIDNTVAVANDSHLDINRMKDNSPLLKKLMHKYNFNPRDLSLEWKNARFFIIKSYSEDDIFRSIKYSSWTSTEHGNRRLNDAFNEQEKTGIKTPIYLLFSVNSSGHFCGVAEMKSKVDFDVETGIFVQDKWKGRFDVRWIYVKDVPNNTLRHIRLENNENKPVTNSRDTQEVHPDKAKQVLKIIHNYKAQTSIFDDFSHYEKRQEEDAKLRVSFLFLKLLTLEVLKTWFIRLIFRGRITITDIMG